MTGPFGPFGVTDAALAGEEPEVAPGRAAERAAEPPERRCARCGAVGTHYLTCPGLRLPSGYRLGDVPGTDVPH